MSLKKNLKNQQSSNVRIPGGAPTTSPTPKEEILKEETLTPPVVTPTVEKNLTPKIEPSPSEIIKEEIEPPATKENNPKKKVSGTFWLEEGIRVRLEYLNYKEKTKLSNIVNIALHNYIQKRLKKEPDLFKGQDFPPLD